MCWIVSGYTIDPVRLASSASMRHRSTFRRYSLPKAAVLRVEDPNVLLRMGPMVASMLGRLVTVDLPGAPCSSGSRSASSR